MRKGFDKVASLAMFDEKFYDEVMEALASLREKGKIYNAERIAKTAKYVPGVGIVHGRRKKRPATETDAEKDQPEREAGTIDPSDIVYDPPDLRGRGCAAKFRLGHPNSTSKRKTTKSGVPTQESHMDPPDQHISKKNRWKDFLNPSFNVVTENFQPNPPF